jgi:iron complex outermembrane recepter protein
MKKKRFPRASIFAACAGAAILSTAIAAPDSDLTTFSLEELSRLTISSVSKKPEFLATSAASVFVISREDIRRLGATTLPEALRLAPNLQVARVNANSWAISARGFNSTTANKMLVLIDGRPVYTPLYSGVFWDVQDLYMPDVERIEVISGPNAAIWGSNAVNGVINVVTQSARDTSGTQVSLITGKELGRAQFRHGKARDENTAWRVYGKYSVDDDSRGVDGLSRRDEKHHAQVGFRMDFDRERDTLSVQGDLYEGGFEQFLFDDAELGGANIVTHWQRELPENARLEISGFYDRTERLLPETLEQRLDTIGLEMRHHIGDVDKHSLLWGLEVRHAMDAVTNFDRLAFLPEDRNMTWASIFVHDLLNLTDRSNLMLGARVEHNEFTGFEFMPDIRLAWMPNEAHTLWIAASRSMRTPSRIDTEFFIPAEPPYAISTSNEFRSEIAEVFEIGFRGQPDPDIYYSVTLFHHRFDNLRSLETQPDDSIMLANQAYGRSTGIEGWLSYDPVESWHVAVGVLWMDRELDLRTTSTAVSTRSEGNDPELQWQLRSSFDISARQELDLLVRHVGALPDPAIPSYTTVDLNWAWNNGRGLRLSLHARNLLDEQHVEFGAPPMQSVFGRNAYANLSWSFD